MTSEANGAGRDPGKRHGVLFAYLMHLGVPLFLLLDETAIPRLAGVRYVRGPGDNILLVLCTLWLILGLGAALRARNRARFLEFVQKPLLSFYTLVLLVAVFEPFARVALKKPSPYPGVWFAGTQRVEFADPSETPGVSGTKRYTVNKLGLRGPDLPQTGNLFRIIAVGGSTTACDQLDDSEEWPQLLMDGLNSRQNQRRVWVANAGVDGHTTVHHLAVVQTLPIFAEADLVIFLIGANDLAATLSSVGAPTEKELEYHAALYAASLRGGQPASYPYLKGLRLFELVHDAVHATLRRFTAEEVRLYFSDMRRGRALGRVAALPDLETGLAEYRERVERLARECKAHQTRCLFLTQPTMWRADLPLTERRLLLLGRVGSYSRPIGYLDVADEQRAMDAFNSALLDVCGRGGLECYDLASRVPKDTSAFFDDLHFNEAGARTVARVLVDYLLSAPPFAETAGSSK